MNLADELRQIALEVNENQRRLPDTKFEDALIFVEFVKRHCTEAAKLGNFRVNFNVQKSGITKDQCKEIVYPKLESLGFKLDNVWIGNSSLLNVSFK